MTVLQALFLAVGALICGGVIGAFFGVWCASAGQEDKSRELYRTQMQLAVTKELNALLIERIQEYERKDAKETVPSD